MRNISQRSRSLAVVDTLRYLGTDGQGVFFARSLGDNLEPAGTRNWSWDARDDAGRAVHPGLYFLRADGAGVADTRRIVVLGR